MNFEQVAEEIHVVSSTLVETVKQPIQEGNIRRIFIKNEQGHTLVEIPVTLAAVGVVAASKTSIQWGQDLSFVYGHRLASTPNDAFTSNQAASIPPLHSRRLFGSHRTPPVVQVSDHL